MNNIWCFHCAETWVCIIIGVFAGAFAVIKSKNYSTIDFVIGVMASALLSVLFCVAGKFFEIIKRNNELLYVGSGFCGYNAQWFFDVVMPKIRKKVLDFLNIGKEVK